MGAKGFMKKLIPLTVNIAFLIYPSVCFSSYLIQLKSGSQFIVYEYWEEAKQIKFYFYGGVVGIPKHFVSTIRESDMAYREETDFEKGMTIENKIDRRSTIASSETEKTPTKENGTEKKAGSEKEKTDEKIDFEYYREKKAVLKGKLAEALERVREATRNRDPEAKKKAREDMKKFSREIYYLKDELKEKNNGVLPDDWWQDS